MFVHRLKLRAPQLLPLWIERDEIERRFHAGIRVFSIVAAAGFGKTVSAAQLYAAFEGPKFWYSLDLSDGDLAVFAMHLEAMVEGVAGVREFGGEAWRQGSPREVGANFAERLAEISPPPLVVFDDVHAIADTRAALTLATLLERGVRAGVSFVLAGRSMPVSLHQIAASAQYASVLANDLAFAPDEARRYFLRAGRARVPNPATGALLRMAEGWPAGLALIASRSTAAGAATAMHAPHGDETRRLLFDYLATEVLAALGERERRLLLNTSILEDLDASLCDVLLGTEDAREILASLAARGLFVTRRGEDAFSCHQLFREFLLDHLKAVAGGAGVALLHRRAARALEAAGERPASIGHLVRAGDLDEAATALEQTARAMLQEGLISSVSRILDALGPGRIDASPLLMTALGRVQRERNLWDDALRSLECAMTLARARREHDVYADALRFWSPMIASRGELDRLQASLYEALTLAPPVSETTATALRVTLGSVFLERGRFDEALAVFREVMPIVINRGDQHTHGVLLNNMAVSHQRRGDPYASIPSYERALKVKYAGGQRISALATLANLALARRVVGELDEAERLVDELLAQAQDVGTSAVLAHGLELQGGIRFDRGDVSGAEAAYNAALATIDTADVLERPDIVYGLARCAAASGRFELALDRCTEAVTAMRAVGRTEECAPAEILRAAALAALGDPAGALGVLRGARALTAAGSDDVNSATCALEAAEVALRIEPLLGAERPEAERIAREGLATAVGLIHERGYRFLLRTRAAAFVAVRPAFARFGIGASLFPETSAEPPAAPPLHIELFGGLRLERAGIPVPEGAWKRRKARDIFTQLVSLRGRSIPRARLVDLYWPDVEADAGHDNLRVTITAIRKAAGDVVKFHVNGYRFVAPAGTFVDVERFEDDVERGRAAIGRGDPASAVPAFRAAVRRYTGDFLDGMDDGNWQWQERERLRAAYLEALRHLARSGDVERADRRAMVDRILAAAPFDLDAIRLRLDDLVDRGRVDEARREYAAWRARYQVTIGAEAALIWRPARRDPAVRDLLPSTGRMTLRP